MGQISLGEVGQMGVGVDTRTPSPRWRTRLTAWIEIAAVCGGLGPIKLKSSIPRPADRKEIGMQQENVIQVLSDPLAAVAGVRSAGARDVQADGTHRDCAGMGEAVGL